LKVYINARFLTQQITGVQQFAVEICRNLSNQNISFVLLAPKGTTCPKALSHLPFQQIGNASGYIWEQIELPSFLKKQGSPLLLNFCNTAPLLYSNQWITIHDLAFMHHPEWFNKSFAKVYRFLIPRIAKRSRKVFTVSKTIQNQLKTLLGLDAEILYNGVAHDILFDSAKTTTRKNYILTVSSINPRKNLKTLIAAFEQANLPNYELIVAGAANAVFGKEQLSVSSNILFTGYVNNAELINLYKQAALFVSLSLDEGFGIPVLEALYLGCPVLLSDIAVYKECFDAVALFTSATNTPRVAKDIHAALNNPIIIKQNNPIFTEYNYGLSAKKLASLLTETHKKM
jgi:glycosyltransferase involved in cell wall biosynthesis